MQVQEEGFDVMQYFSRFIAPVPWAQHSFETDLLHLGTGSTRSQEDDSDIS